MTIHIYDEFVSIQGELRQVYSSVTQKTGRKRWEPVYAMSHVGGPVSLHLEDELAELTEA